MKERWFIKIVEIDVYSVKTKSILVAACLNNSAAYLVVSNPNEL